MIKIEVVVVVVIVKGRCYAKSHRPSKLLGSPSKVSSEPLLSVQMPPFRNRNFLIALLPTLNLFGGIVGSTFSYFFYLTMMMHFSI
jgi:hypothetical protein